MILKMQIRMLPLRIRPLNICRRFLDEAGKAADAAAQTDEEQAGESAGNSSEASGQQASEASFDGTSAEAADGTTTDPTSGSVTERKLDHCLQSGRRILQGLHSERLPVSKER